MLYSLTAVVYAVFAPVPHDATVAYILLADDGMLLELHRAACSSCGA
jgi:hypothetical protein